MEAGKLVHVHCWGGVGRTGLVIGCWPAKHCGSGSKALERVAELWKTCPKSRRRRESPETEDQKNYVRNWRNRRRRDGCCRSWISPRATPPRRQSLSEQPSSLPRAWRTSGRSSRERATRSRPWPNPHGGLATDEGDIMKPDIERHRWTPSANGTACRYAPRLTSRRERARSALRKFRGS